MIILRSTYTHAVTLAGGVPVVISSTLDQNTLRVLYDQLDGILLSGGGDVHPSQYGSKQISPFTDRIDNARDHVEIQLVRWAVEDDKPLLAICRGHQVLNVALGGTLIQDIREEVPRALRHDSPDERWFDHILHDVILESDTPLSAALKISGEIMPVNSLHHQALGRIAPGLEVAARAPDDIIEGVTMPERRFIIGVQWHPEALVDDRQPMLNLFKSFIESATLGQTNNLKKTQR